MNFLVVIIIKIGVLKLVLCHSMKLASTFLLIYSGFSVYKKLFLGFVFYAAATPLSVSLLSHLAAGGSCSLLTKQELSRGG